MRWKSGYGKCRRRSGRPLKVYLELEPTKRSGGNAIEEENERRSVRGSGRKIGRPSDSASLGHEEREGREKCGVNTFQGEIAKRRGREHPGHLPWVECLPLVMPETIGMGRVGDPAGEGCPFGLWVVLHAPPLVLLLLLGAPMRMVIRGLAVYVIATVVMMWVRHDGSLTLLAWG